MPSHVMLYKLYLHPPLNLMQGSSLPPPLPSRSQRPLTYPQIHSVPSYYNSHYVQAYSQTSASPSIINNASPNFGTHLLNNSPASGLSKTSFLDSKSVWYQSGNSCCNQQGCTFFGS